MTKYGLVIQDSMFQVNWVLKVVRGKLTHLKTQENKIDWEIWSNT